MPDGMAQILRLRPGRGARANGSAQRRHLPAAAAQQWRMTHAANAWRCLAAKTMPGFAMTRGSGTGRRGGESERPETTRARTVTASDGRGRMQRPATALRQRRDLRLFLMTGLLQDRRDLRV